jgi:hypothetical protein
MNVKTGAAGDGSAVSAGTYFAEAGRAQARFRTIQDCPKDLPGWDRL